MHKINFEKYIQLYSSCLLTKGFTQSLLVDTQRKSFELIPNELYTILHKRTKKETYGSILASFDKPEQKTIHSYISYFSKKEYIFFCDKNEIALFPKMNLEWYYPGEVSNAIIDFEDEPDSIEPYCSFIRSLGNFGCSVVQIRCYNSFPLQKLKMLLDCLIENNIFRSELFIKFDPNITLEEYSKFLQSSPIINTLYVHSFIKDSEIKVLSDQSFFVIKQNIESETCCGNVSKHYLNLSLTHYSESQQFNTCLNKKISVDKKGFIKKCPSMKQVLGHIKTSTIDDVINGLEYSHFDSTSKDKIKVCKVCEFRHVCTDCRAYTMNNDTLGKPLKCNYDPFTGTYS